MEEAKQQYLAPRSKINKSMENSEVISLTVISCGTREQVRYSTEIQSKCISAMRLRFKCHFLSQINNK